MEKSRESGLTLQEQQEWDQYAYVEHLVRLARANSLVRLMRAVDQ